MGKEKPFLKSVLVFYFEILLAPIQKFKTTVGRGGFKTEGTGGISILQKYIPNHYIEP